VKVNKYKFQGQERQDELSLNWDSFKWRNYDFAIGRFMNIDPLAEQYTYNSPYAFQERIRLIPQMLCRMYGQL
jgi:RHS repeat-associated protein